MAQHEKLKTDVCIQVYFRVPHNLERRGINENTNGILRQHFPSCIDLGARGKVDLVAVT